MSDDANSSDGQNGKTWLRQVLSDIFSTEPRGDVIVGQVGEGARGVAIGKNIIQVGTLVLPTVPVIAALLLIAVVVAGGLWIALVPAEMPLGSFNVAVAEFGQMDAQGRVTRSENGRKLSEWLFRELEAEYEDFPTGRPVVWHDSMGMLEKRARIGMIRSDEAAAELADEVKAHMVIYGTLSVGDEATFTPEFYVDEIRAEADEIVGPHQLGSPVEVRLPIDPYDPKTSEYLKAELGARTEALTWFTRALVLDLSGRHREALDVLRQAEADLQDWDENEGKEVLYYFIGREALFLSRDDATFLPVAEEAFAKALEINPNYARAHIGLGGVFYERAQHLQPDLRLETADLEQAVAEYELAVQKGSDSPGSQVDLKGRLGLGTVYRLQGEAYLNRGEHDKAADAYSRAVEEIENALPLIEEQQHRLLAQGYQALGAAYHGKAHVLYAENEMQASKPVFESARAAYTECINQADADFYDTFLQHIKTNRCQPQREAVQETLDSLEGEL